jgi:hypothetical protein
MSLQRFSKQIFSRMRFAFACCGLALMHQFAHAQMDGAFIQRTMPERPATQSDIPDYDSDYAAASRLTDAGDSTPEADARPGEYYFRLGAHAFRTKNYTFAIQMYQVSASWAYKPAEYNIAVMYARGQGVPVDLPRAMAWVALAAERDEKHYVDAREAIYAEMSKEQFEQANGIWRGLKTTYGDEVALRRAKARWAEVRANMTGSRVGSQAGTLIVSIPQPNSGTGGSANGKSLPVPTKNGKPPPNEKYGGRVGATTASEIVGSQTTDGATAYRQFRQTDNPYDPKLDRTAFGTAMVGPPSEVKAGDNKESATDKPESTKHDQ